MQQNSRWNLFKIPLILIFVVIIFSLGFNSVSASCVNTSQYKIYVSNHGNDSWNGQNSVWDGNNGPKATITNASTTVKKYGTIYILNGTYNEQNICIDKDMDITGENLKNTIINAQNDKIFNIVPGITVKIENVTLINGFGGFQNQCGGAICNNGTLTVKNCNFTGNTALMGGAIFNVGYLTVNDSTFTNNMGLVGGAIFNSDFLTVTNSNFIDNTAYEGGAILNVGNPIFNIVSCKFIGNTPQNIYNASLSAGNSSGSGNSGSGWGTGSSGNGDNISGGFGNGTGNGTGYIHSKNSIKNTPTSTVNSKTDLDISIIKTTKTIGMQNTGIPITGLIIALLMVVVGSLQLKR